MCLFFLTPKEEIKSNGPGSSLMLRRKREERQLGERACSPVLHGYKAVRDTSSHSETPLGHKEKSHSPEQGASASPPTPHMHS